MVFEVEKHSIKREQQNGGPYENSAVGAYQVTGQSLRKVRAKTDPRQIDIGGNRGAVCMQIQQHERYHYGDSKGETSQKKFPIIYKYQDHKQDSRDYVCGSYHKRKRQRQTDKSGPARFRFSSDKEINGDSEHEH